MQKTHWGFHIVKLYNKQVVFSVLDAPTKTTNLRFNCSKQALYKIKIPKVRAGILKLRNSTESFNLQLRFSPLYYNEGRNELFRERHISYAKQF